MAIRFTHTARAVVALGCVASLALSAAGCSADNDKPVTLKFWTWSLKNTDERALAIIDEYEKQNSNVKIELTEVGGTADTSSKILAADRANEVPDIVQVEYRGLPALVVKGVVKDLTDSIGDSQSAVAENIWELSTVGDAIYGIPQDIGPMMLTYRADLFEEYGAPEPTTWENYVAAAEIIREKNPDAYIASFSANEFEFFAAHSAQAGAKWWQAEGDSWEIGLSSSESLEVADFWSDLVDRDLLSVEPLLTPEWNAKVNDGRLLSWAAAAWAPSVIYSVAPGTAGKWKSVPLPQWNAGDASVPFLGGSTYFVPEKSKNAEEAIKFAKWLGASDEGSKLLLSLDLYPAGNAGREAAKQNDPPRLMPEQSDFYSIADAIIDDTTISMSWGPNVNVGQTNLGDLLNKAALEKKPLRDAFIATQKIIEDDLRETGYTVK